MENQEKLTIISSLAASMRRNVLEMALAAGSASAHIGGGLSVIEIIATLFGGVMKFDRENPEWLDRDRFILSKGHGCLGLYAALIEVGLIPRQEITTFEKTGSNLLGHPVINRQIGIEFSNGSLGMGLSLGIGVAIAGKKRGKDYRVYVLMGDGECNEGAIWEGAMAAAHFNLDNLIGIVDRNRYQQTGAGNDIMDLKSIRKKWVSFGWNTLEVDGHDVEQLYNTFTNNVVLRKPLMIIANTIKGKGISTAEENNEWHHTVLTKAQYELALKEL